MNKREILDQIIYLKEVQLNAFNFSKYYMNNESLFKYWNKKQKRINKLEKYLFKICSLEVGKNK